MQWHNQETTLIEQSRGYFGGDLNIIIPAAAPAAAAFPPDEPVLSVVPWMLKVLDVNPDEAAGDVDVGGVVGGTRPGCGRLGATPGVNDAGVALFSPGFLAKAFGGPGGTTSGSSGKV